MLEVCYRIYTEDKNVETIIQETSSMFTSFTVYHAQGMYRAQEESSLILEFILEHGSEHGFNHNLALVKCLAGSIKIFNVQHSVLVTYHYIKSVSI